MYTFMKLWFFKLHNYKTRLGLRRTVWFHSVCANSNLWVLCVCVGHSKLGAHQKYNLVFILSIPMCSTTTEPSHFCWTPTKQKDKENGESSNMRPGLLHPLSFLFSIFPLSNLPTLILTGWLESLKTIILQYLHNNCISLMLFYNI